MSLDEPPPLPLGFEMRCQVMVGCLQARNHHSDPRCFCVHPNKGQIHGERHMSVEIFHDRFLLMGSLLRASVFCQASGDPPPQHPLCFLCWFQGVSKGKAGSCTDRCQFTSLLVPTSSCCTCLRQEPLPHCPAPPAGLWN